MNEPKKKTIRSYRKRPKALLSFTSTVPVRKRDKDAAHLVGYVRVSMSDQNNQRQMRRRLLKAIRASVAQVISFFTTQGERFLAGDRLLPMLSVP